MRIEFYTKVLSECDFITIFNPLLKQFLYSDILGLHNLQNDDNYNYNVSLEEIKQNSNNYYKMDKGLNKSINFIKTRPDTLKTESCIPIDDETKKLKFSSQKRLTFFKK